MSRFEKVVHANFRKSDEFLKDTNIQLVMYELQTWYARIVNLTDGVFTGGEYLLKIIIPDTFPHTAPDIKVLTPNGVYSNNGSIICTGYGAHHQNTYTPAKGIHGVLGAVLGNILDWKQVDHGIGFIKTSNDVKKKLARESSAYNMKHYPEIVNYFELKYGK